MSDIQPTPATQAAEDSRRRPCEDALRGIVEQASRGLEPGGDPIGVLYQVAELVDRARAALASAEAEVTPEFKEELEESLAHEGGYHPAVEKVAREEGPGQA